MTSNSNNKLVMPRRNGIFFHYQRKDGTDSLKPEASNKEPPAQNQKHNKIIIIHNKSIRRKKQYKPKASIMQQFTLDIHKLITWISPNKQQIMIRNGMFLYITERICDLEKQKNKQCGISGISEIGSIQMKVYKFGSELWNVSCGGSDIDIAITINNNFSHTRKDTQQLLRDLLQIIINNNANGLYIIDKDYEQYLNATYPIVRIHHRISQIKMDISIASPWCMPTNTYILLCIEKFRTQEIPIRKLIIFIKYWSKQRQINDSYHQYLNSFGYTVMVIKYIQYYISKSNDINASQLDLSELVYGFFEFYSVIFNFDEYILSIKSTTIFSRKENAFPMEIIDPMNKSKQNNIAANVGYYQRYNIMKELSRAYDILMTNKKNKKHKIKQSLFSQLMEKQSQNGNRNIYVKYMPSHWNEQRIRQIFESHTGGSIVKIEMWKSYLGVSAILTFEFVKYSKIAIAKLNGMSVGINPDTNINASQLLYVGKVQKREWI